MKPQIVLLAGTTEGRLLARSLSGFGQSVLVCVATDYGRDILLADLHGVSGVTVRAGRMDENQLVDMLQAADCLVLVDATHPYAQEATLNARNACSRAGVEYIRVLRPAAEFSDEVETAVDCAQAARLLSEREGAVLLTVGSRELEAFTCIENYQSRCYARVLPVPEVMVHCRQLGFTEEHLIAAQGPFSMEENIQMIQQTGAAHLVTKDSGAAGGFPEKLAAVRETGIHMLLIARPREEGFTPEQALQLLWRRFKGSGKQRTE